MNEILGIGLYSVIGSGFIGFVLGFSALSPVFSIIGYTCYSDSIEVVLHSATDRHIVMQSPLMPTDCIPSVSEPPKPTRTTDISGSGEPSQSPVRRLPSSPCSAPTRQQSSLLLLYQLPALCNCQSERRFADKRPRATLTRLGDYCVDCCTFCDCHRCRSGCRRKRDCEVL